MRSVSYQTGTPYTAVYVATRAVVIAARHCLHPEYEDRPVDFSAPSPASVDGTCMHEVHKHEAGPATFLKVSTTVDAVVDEEVAPRRGGRSETLSSHYPCGRSSGWGGPSRASRTG